VKQNVALKGGGGNLRAQINVKFIDINSADEINKKYHCRAFI
jgi:hypothetical protein